MSKILIEEVPPHINGGESLFLEYQFIDGILTQSITLNSYGNSAVLNLSGNVLFPGFLRELADKLEVFIEEA